ncbi:MAG TPA: hypothetical protein VIT88_14990 [Pyrinomonadaceae bacterium]
MKRQTLLLLSLSILFPATSAQFASAKSDSHKVFFANVKKLCGRQFEGETKFPQDAAHPLFGKKLIMSVASCTDNELRIPFQVGEDKSRTWILTLTDKGLLFKHDHRHEDGTPDKITMYGGWAAAGGTAHSQKFPADADTAKLIPEAVTNVWKFEINREKQQFTYSLERHGKPRYEAVFNLKPAKRS